MHLCAEIDLEVFGVVKDVEKGTAFIKLGDAEEKQSTVSYILLPLEQM